VAGGNGFGMHPHANFEIFSVVLDGALEHKDSMGNRDVLKRGAVQFTSAGSGIYHSEYNASKKDLVHFLQIWVKPDVKDIKPSYITKEWSDAEKTNVLKKIISTDGSDDSIKIHQDISVFTSILETGKSLKYTLAEGRAGYLHLAQTGGGLTLNGSTSLSFATFIPQYLSSFHSDVCF
jgi:redox-sensitive bicupin YhaK (pirin superfamily)